MTTPLRDLLDAAVGSGTVPGAAALVARGDEVEIGGAGELEPDSIARIASITKPITVGETGFYVPAEKLGRLPTYRGADCAPIDERLWTEPPIFPSGSGRLVSTLSDLHRFRRMLLASGDALLSHESVRLVTTDHLTQAQRDASTLFLEGAGWGFGGAVGADGRYGWIGGTARPRSRAIDTDPRRRALAFERGAQNVRPSPALR